MRQQTIQQHGTITGRIKTGVIKKSAVEELRFNDELPEAEEVTRTTNPYDERQYIRDTGRR